MVDDEVRRVVSGSSTLPWSIMVRLTILSYTFCSPDNLVKRNYFAFSMSPIRFGFGLVGTKKNNCLGLLDQLDLEDKKLLEDDHFNTSLIGSLYQIRNIYFYNLGIIISFVLYIT